ncbi:MAG: hypothetical protein PHO65_03725 [Sulfurovum sp.]|nr:hypothetical protein [Sulfurovum sp.]
MKQLKMFCLTTMAMVFTACGGGGGSSLPTVDNSQVEGVLENQYGYFGENVQFGNYKITQSWTLINLDTLDTLHLRFYSDGEMKHSDSSFMYDYGISKDGLTFVSELGEEGSITSVEKDFYEIHNTDGSIDYYDCYHINNQSNVIMCPGYI